MSRSTSSAFITVEFTNYDKVLQGLEDCQKKTANGIRRISLGMVRRNKSGGNAIGSIASKQARQVYNISKKEFDARMDCHYDETGSVTLAGVSIPSFLITIKSSPNRTFTPIHFSMNPTARPARRKYPVTMKPLRGGGKVAIEHEKGFPTFLASSNGSPSLPFARVSPQHKPIEVIPTKLSPPQMVDNEKVRPNVEKEICDRVRAKVDALKI